MKASGLPNPETITRVALENGIVVLVYENDAAQSVFLLGTLQAGSLFESAAENGLAALTSGALMRGTQHRDFDTLHSTLEGIGADLNVNIGPHKVGFNGKALAEDLETMVALLADVLRYPAFPPQQVERLRGEMLTWLQYRQQDTRWLAGRSFRENLYPPVHPYHRSTYGTQETLAALSASQLENFHKQYYGPDGMVIVISGAVKAPAAVDIVRQHFADWHNPQQPPVPALPPVPPLIEIKQVHTYVPGKTQSDLIMGVVGPSRFAPDYLAAQMANSVLGQFGMMGRLGQVIREEKGLAYYAGSRLDGGYGPGAWSVLAGVNPAHVRVVVEAVFQEIDQMLTQPVSADDLADNKSYFVGRLPLQLETNEGIASSVLSMENYGLGLDYLVNYPQMVEALTAGDLLAAVQQYWTRDALVISVAGPE